MWGGRRSFTWWKMRGCVRSGSWNRSRNKIPALATLNCWVQPWKCFAYFFKQNQINIYWTDRFSCSDPEMQLKPDIYRHFRKTKTCLYRQTANQSNLIVLDQYDQMLTYILYFWNIRTKRELLDIFITLIKAISLHTLTLLCLKTKKTLDNKLLIG